MSPTPVIWLAGGPLARERAQRLAQDLRPACRPLFIGPAGEPAPDLVVPLDGLSLALTACPEDLRPAALLCLDPAEPPEGMEKLPCPTLAWGAPAPGCDRDIPLQPDLAVRALRDAARQGRAWPWLERVQVNLPLRMLLGRYRALAVSLPVNPEVGIDAPALDELTPGDVALAATLLRNRRVSVHLPFLDLSPGSPDPAIARVSLERLNLAADWALELGAISAVLHLGYSPDTHRDLAAFCSRLAAGLAPLAARLQDGGSSLVMENTFEPAPQVLLAARQAILDAGGPEVGFCLDVGHAHCFSPTPLAAWWEGLSPHIQEMHLHDNDATFDHHHAPGCGVVDWDYLQRRLSELADPPLLTLEPHSEPHLWAFLRGLERVWGAPPQGS